MIMIMSIQIYMGKYICIYIYIYIQFNKEDCRLLQFVKYIGMTSTSLSTIGIRSNRETHARGTQHTLQGPRSHVINTFLFTLHHNKYNLPVLYLGNLTYPNIGHETL